METHKVLNQSPVFENIDLFNTNKYLKRLSSQFKLEAMHPSFSKYGSTIGNGEWIRKAKLANDNSPKFHSHDIKGNRIDYVEFHPAYHDFMELAISNDVHALPWVSKMENAQMARFILNYLDNQGESGTSCPITMTYSAAPVLSKHFPMADEWIPKIVNNIYDSSNQPYFDKKGLTIGMAMTEKQGGSDVRANTTYAIPAENDKRDAGDVYYITGHKWFCSAPMCDGFLTLAQTEKGLSCFLFPRWKPDGVKNDFRIQRLKDKLGNRSNASCEIEFDGAFAWLLGVEGRGVATIIEMVSLTRYDCMIGSSAIKTRSLSEVVHHIKHRSSFGKKLINQPLMQNVVADLYLETEASFYMSARVAQSLENQDKEEERQLLRLLTPVGKYWLTKRAVNFVGEAMECMGGNGYIEDSIFPRYYRETPVNAIWEGSGNVQCLDLLRALKKSPAIRDILIHQLRQQKGKVGMYDTFIENCITHVRNPEVKEIHARIVVSEIALALQAAMMLENSDAAVAEAFCLSRLDNKLGFQFGCIADKQQVNQIIEWNESE